MFFIGQQTKDNSQQILFKFLFKNLVYIKNL